MPIPKFSPSLPCSGTAHGDVRPSLIVPPWFNQPLLICEHLQNLRIKTLFRVAIQSVICQDVRYMKANQKEEYICQRCGTCCRWPGIVKLQPEEPALIADYLGITPAEFIARYTLLAPDRKSLILTEQSDGSCTFLKGNDCQIHPVKPQQCQDFPLRWNFAGFEKLCRAKRVPSANGQ